MFCLIQVRPVLLGLSAPLVDHHDIDPAFGYILEQLLQRRTFHIAARPAAIS